MMGLAYAHGSTDAPLLGETISENLAKTVARFGERDAVIVRHQDVRWSYAELAGVRWLFAATSFKSSDYVAMVDEVGPKCEALERTVFFGSDEWDEL
ncbi:MAG TPA: hypothetical protein VGI54_04240, partial [Solirubrobacteraceae bacterium]